MPRKGFDFKSCSFEEAKQELLTYSNNRVYVTRGRYKDDSSTLDKINLVFSIIIQERKMARYVEPFRGAHARVASMWRSMMKRCVGEIKIEKHISYEGCEVSELFQNLDNFKIWCFSQKGFSEVDEKGRAWEIDKDMLSGSAKVYSENTCVFIPKEINVFIRYLPKHSGLPTGVMLNKTGNKFVAQCGSLKQNRHLGTFETVEDARIAYASARSESAKRLAEKWGDRLDSRVSEFLRNY